MYNRGIIEPAQIELFLTADERLKNNPFLLPDMERAVARLYHALISGETIAIYGDFDVDGVCGTALLSQALSSLGGRVIPYIPHRLKEGYGLNLTALESLKQQGATLVITVDCGTSAITEVEYARRIGLDVIVTDHHLTPSLIPQAQAVINPQRRDSNYPFLYLAGVGVAFKLLEALFQSLGREQELEELLDLVALGAVADVVPLLGENRYLVKRGLDVLNKRKRLGLREMIHRAGLASGDIDTEAISWILAPRLNAPGRLDHAITSYKLLVTNSPEEAQKLAQELEQINAERQRLTDEVLAKAREKLFTCGIDSPLLMVGGEDYHPGVIGLVASKLVDEFYRPCVVFQQGQDITRGSARSIPEFNITATLEECQELLTRFGGHPLAAGFTLPTQNLPLLWESLLHIAERELSGKDLSPFLTIEAEIPLSTIRGGVFNAIGQLTPFGYSNPEPNLLSRRVEVMECRRVGNEGEHLKLKLKEGNAVWEGVGFDLGPLATEVTPYIDIVYNLRVDRWGREEVLQLHILDFAPSKA